VILAILSSGGIGADTLAPTCIHPTGFLEGLEIPASSSWVVVQTQLVNLIANSDVALQTNLRFKDHGSYVGGIPIEYRYTVDGVRVDVEFRGLTPLRWVNEDD